MTRSGPSAPARRPRPAGGRRGAHLTARDRPARGQRGKTRLTLALTPNGSEGPARGGGGGPSRWPRRLEPACHNSRAPRQRLRDRQPAASARVTRVRSADCSNAGGAVRRRPERAKERSREGGTTPTPRGPRGVHKTGSFPPPLILARAQSEIPISPSGGPPRWLVEDLRQIRSDTTARTFLDARRCRLCSANSVGGASIGTHAPASQESRQERSPGRLPAGYTCTDRRRIDRQRERPLLVKDVLARRSK